MHSFRRDPAILTSAGHLTAVLAGAAAGCSPVAGAKGATGRGVGAGA